VGHILTVKFGFVLNFESVLYNIFCTFKFDGSLPFKAVFIINEFNETETWACKSFVLALLGIYQIFEQDAK
jgi:hypothetical protein